MSSPAASVNLDTGSTHEQTGTVPARFGSQPLSAGGSSRVPVQTRSERFSSPVVADYPDVTGLELEWKLTPVAKLRQLTGGTLDGAPWRHEAEHSAGVELGWIDRADARVGSAGVPEERASANAWSSFEKALSIVVSGEDAQTAVVTRSHLAAAPSSAHIVITAKANARGKIVLLNSGDAHLSENVEIVLEDGAQLTVVSVQRWNSSAIHLASHFARIGRNAHLRHISISLDGAIIRLNPTVHLVGEGGDVDVFGAYFATTGQHIEQHVFIDHDAARTRSRVNYKGALQGPDARTVWVGDVLIRQTGVGTDSYEQNRNLLLTDGARADSIPNLEIETGDIAGAGHASASGRFDDEQLFYLQTRGISEEEAKRLVVRGFLTEIVQKIGSADLEASLQSAIEAALVPGGGRS